MAGIVNKVYFYHCTFKFQVFFSLILWHTYQTYQLTLQFVS